MANNDRKQISRFVAPRCGAISYVFIFLSLSTSYGGFPQKSTKKQKNEGCQVKTLDRRSEPPLNSETQKFQRNTLQTAKLFHYSLAVFYFEEIKFLN